MRSEDGSIIYRCLNGESEAFGLLVDKYKAGIYSFVYAKLHDFHNAQDVTQEVFIQAYRDLRSLRHWESFVFWLYRIASTRCKMWTRSQTRRPESEFIEDQDPSILVNHSMDSYRSDQKNESLQDALNSLPETYREVLLLHYFGGMTSKDIAKALGISPMAVLQRLNRARSQLREEMVGVMSEAFKQQRLQASFTFHIAEIVKRIRIHPVSQMKGLPWGISLATGLMITFLSLNPYIPQLSQPGILSGSPLPSETKVLKVGEIPVDVVKISNVAILSSNMGKGKGGEPKQPDVQNAFFMAPQGEGGEWVKKADMPTERDALYTCVVNGKIYAIGGRTVDEQGNDVVIKTVEEYDPVKDNWTKKADMPTARCFLSISVVDGKIYAIGGFSKYVGNALSTVEVYDPVTDTWSKGLDMPTARRGLSTSVVNGKIYAIGGDNKFGPCLSTVEEYDPVKDEWTKKADIPTARFGLSTSVVNGEIYAIGGIPVNVQAWNALSTVEVYNPTTDTWTKKADMPTPRTNFSTCVANGKIYAVGGALVQPSVVTSKVEVYDPATDTWREKADMQFARGWLSASAVSGKIYAIGGSTDVDFLQTVEEYTPEGWPFAVSSKGKLPSTWGQQKAK